MANLDFAKAEQKVFAILSDLPRLKKEARKTYLEYQEILGTFSCGANLAETISKDLYAAKVRFNKLMDTMALVDPNCPKGRL